jgi:NitT/TauT family transport system substrate-binding protein
LKRSAFAALTTAAVCAAPAVVRGQTVPVRIGTSPVEAYALVFYAREQGFFTRNGIDAQIQSFPGGGPITDAIVGGALDFGCASIGPASNAHLRGIPLRLIAAGGIYTSAAPTTQLAVAKTSTIAAARDLNGKTIGTSALRDLQHVAVLKWMDQNGGDSKTVRAVELPAFQAPGAIATGRVDAYPLVEPVLTNSRNDVRVIGSPYDSITRRLMIGMHVAHGDWLEKNGATARKIVLALRQAAQWANANPVPSGAILEQITKIPAATIAEMKRVVYGETLEPGTIQPQIDVLAEYGFIPKRYPVSEMAWT